MSNYNNEVEDEGDRLIAAYYDQWRGPTLMVPVEPNRRRQRRSESLTTDIIVWRYLQEHGPCISNNIMKDTGYSRTKVNRALGRLQKTGQVRMISNRRIGAHWYANVYSITGE